MIIDDLIWSDPYSGQTFQVTALVVWRLFQERKLHSDWSLSLHPDASWELGVSLSDLFYYSISSFSLFPPLSVSIRLVQPSKASLDRCHSTHIHYSCP